ETDGAHAPGAVARAENGVALQFDALTGDLDRAFIRTVLGETGIVHYRARTLAVREAWLFHRRRAGMEGDVGLDAMRIVADAHTQDFQGFDDLNGNRADLGIHPLHVEQPRGVQIMLHAAIDHGEGRVHHVQMRVNAECNGEIDRTVRR